MNIYGRREQARLTDQIACADAAPGRQLRVVASEGLTGGRGWQAFYSTSWTASAEQVIAWYEVRWSGDVTIHDSKQCLGVAEPQGWTRRSEERSTTVALLLYSRIVLWLGQDGHALS